MSVPGRQAAVTAVLAPNPGPMTLDGTNTWLLQPTSGPALVVDPGPDVPAHLDAVLAACPAGVETVLLTHHHADHVEAAPSLAARTGATVRALLPELCRPGTDREGRTGGADQPPDPVRTAPTSELALTDGDRLGRPGLEVEVLHLPGHTGDSLGLLVTTADGVSLLTGDTVLGRGTSVIAHPEGNLGDYLTSLRRLQQVVARHGVRELLPGHGPVLGRPAEVLAEYLRHRLERLEQVRSARAAGASGAEEVVGAVYGSLEPTLHRAALRSVRAQLEHLAASGG